MHLFTEGKFALSQCPHSNFDVEIETKSEEANDKDYGAYGHRSFILKICDRSDNTDWDKIDKYYQYREYHEDKTPESSTYL